MEKPATWKHQHRNKSTSKRLLSYQRTRKGWSSKIEILWSGTAAFLPHTISVAPLPAASRGLDSHWTVSRWHPPFLTGTVSEEARQNTIKIQSVIKPKMSRIKKKNHAKNQGNLNLNEKRQLTSTPR